MVAAVKFNTFPKDCAHKVHHLGTDTLKLLLTNTAPVAATDVVVGTLVDITAGFGYSAGGPTLVTSSSGQIGGVYSLVLEDLVLTASGGDIGPFRYAVIYNSIPTSPLKPLICYYDLGASFTIINGAFSTFNFDNVTGVLTLT